LKIIFGKAHANRSRIDFDRRGGEKKNLPALVWQFLEKPKIKL
jgi:hypothetical protein